MAYPGLPSPPNSNLTAPPGAQPSKRLRLAAPRRGLGPVNPVRPARTVAGAGAGTERLGARRGPAGRTWESLWRWSPLMSAGVRTLRAQRQRGGEWRTSGTA